jgi:hypothetical protein
VAHGEDVSGEITGMKLSAQLEKFPYPRIEPTGYTSCGRTEFVLTENFHLNLFLGWGDYDLYVNAGVKTDFGSVPWPLRLLYNPLNPKLLVGWLVHDDLYARHVTTRFFADSLTRYIHQCYGAGWWLRVPVYYAVRIFGWWPWRRVKIEKMAEQIPDVAAQVKVWALEKGKEEGVA